MEQVEEELKDGNVSPSSSPPTPPSPLPISVGPGNRKYTFSSSPSPSPPFSPPLSGHVSADNLPLLLDTLSTPASKVPLAFSLDRKIPEDQNEDTTSCLKDLVDWILERCCCCLSWSPQIFYQRQKQD
ncbi:General transcription factor IIH subunit like [Melia azedarach]|uniref:General transcription factor IIH subunit like n=1 Tax=Melia azedarach TaxID=155640 RepID=A0ACC1Y5N5_MELAZ|nr:General transcription factor IIH subunit like [Melia azedarach]